MSFWCQLLFRCPFRCEFWELLSWYLDVHVHLMSFLLILLIEQIISMWIRWVRIWLASKWSWEMLSRENSACSWQGTYRFGSFLPLSTLITMLSSDNENLWQCSISIVTTLWSGWPCSVWSIYPVLMCLRLNPQYGLSVPCLFQADRAGYFYEGAVSSNTLLVLVRIWPHARLVSRCSSTSRMKIVMRNA